MPPGTLPCASPSSPAKSIALNKRPCRAVPQASNSHPHLEGSQALRKHWPSLSFKASVRNTRDLPFPYVLGMTLNRGHVTFGNCSLFQPLEMGRKGPQDARRVG